MGVVVVGTGRYVVGPQCAPNRCPGTGNDVGENMTPAPASERKVETDHDTNLKNLVQVSKAQQRHTNP